MRIIGLIVLAGVLADSAAPPAAPQVTVGADPLKVLQFHWLPVPGATHYLLQIKPNASSAFAVHGNPILAPRALAGLTIPVHTLDWVNARYKVSACNAAGCRDSAEISVQDLMLTSIGYVKASNTDAQDAFGYRLQLSQDGNTLVVSAFEGSDATGVNGNQADNSSSVSGAVYVFRRIGVGWRQEAYLKPDVNHPFQYFGLSFDAAQRPISVSSNGSVVAVGAPGEQFGSVQGAGAVYLFARAPDGTWSQTHKIRLPVPLQNDTFGMSVDLNDDGTLLKVASRNPYTAQFQSVGTTRVYRLSPSGWVVDAFWISELRQSCASQMTGSGTTIVSICSGDEGAPRLRTQRRIGTNWTQMTDFPLYDYFSYVPAVSGNGARAAVAVRNFETGIDRVMVLAWTGRQWMVEQYVEPPPGAANEMRVWGESLAFNRNGTVLAIGDSSSSVGGAGVSDSARPPTTPPPSNEHGAVYVYQRGESGWTFRKVVKAPNPAHSDFFGRGIALSGNGLTLAVGAIGEDGAARGIDGNQADNSKETAGAVYLY
jgi:hypothetical protein